MNRRRLIVFTSLSLAAGLVLAVSQFKYHVVPKRFRVVEAGQIYRGGWQQPRVLRRLLGEHRVTTLLNVACDPAEQDAAGEGAVVRELGVVWHKILMPGTGLGTLEQLDVAADIIAARARRPIFVHCAAGVHRTNMAIAAYRLKHCGWPLDETLGEMARFGFDRSRDWEQEVHLRSYVAHLGARL